MLDRKNTKLHWTALAVARYYERHETACRTRDLYPYLEEFIGSPDQLASQLSKLNEGEQCDRVWVKSEDRNGTSRQTAAYYPTPITIEALRDLGLPDKFPDGRAIPEDLSDMDLPTDRIAAEDSDDVPLPDAPSEPLQYEHTGQGYTTEEESEPREVTYAGVISGDDEPMTTDEASTADDDQTEPTHECDECGATFDTGTGLDGHKPCPQQQIKEQVQDENSLTEEGEYECETCGETFDTPQQKGAHSPCSEDEAECPWPDCPSAYSGTSRGVSIHVGRTHDGIHPDDVEADRWENVTVDKDDESTDDESTEEESTDEIPPWAKSDDESTDEESTDDVDESPSKEDMSSETEDDDMEKDDQPTTDEEEVIRPPTGTDSLPGPSTDQTKPGRLASEYDMQIAYQLEEMAEKAHNLGLNEMARAYSQFAADAAENRLDQRTMQILLGTPVRALEETRTE